MSAINPTLASAAVVACLGVPGDELGLIAATTAAQLDALPAATRIGYAVDAESGEITPPGAQLPPGRTLFLSARIDLSDTPDPAAHAQDVIAALSGTGWRLDAGPVPRAALDRSVAVIRARPADLPARLPAPLDGRGVVLGVVDFGGDFAHPAFLDAAGRTRLLFLWDQNGPGGGAVPGRMIEPDAIQAALAQPDPYAALGYWPDHNVYAPAAARRSDLVHGTHVLGVAAGAGLADCPAGVAPGATLAFVHLRPGALVSTGDPADVFDGVCAIFHRARTLGAPAVVNLSLGANWGSHDGNTLYDAALDALLAQPGRAIAVSAGNDRQAGLNLDGTVARDQPVAFGWRFGQGDVTPNTLRIFAPLGPQPLLCHVRLPGAASDVAVAPGRNAAVLARGATPSGLLYAGEAVEADGTALQHIELRVVPSGAPELVQVTLSTESAQPIAFDAWIDRDDRAPMSQSQFDQAPPITRSTLTCTACGRRTVTVGAIMHRLPALPPATFSAEGTTRDQRRKPDVAAPGVDVLAPLAYGGRAVAGQVWRNGLAIRMSGTSAASPHVAGVIALLLQAQPTLTGEQIGTLLRDTAARDAPHDPWHPQLGYGRVDAAAALAALRP